MNRAFESSRMVHIQTDQVDLEGDLGIPNGSKGIVVFVHGSGSSRHSPRNQFVAADLQASGLATLLFDLLTAEEEQEDMLTRELRFDIPMLARRTSGVIDWLNNNPDTSELNIGLFGASTGAAAALIAAAQQPEQVSAIVSRGGRPDLAGNALAEVRAPTLMIVGGRDDVVLALNDQAMQAMPPETHKEMQIIPGATHLFEEPGALNHVAAYARDWFRRYL